MENRNQIMKNSTFLKEIRFHYWIFLLILTAVVAVINASCSNQPVYMRDQYISQITIKPLSKPLQPVDDNPYNKEDLQCLVHALWHEARGEGEEGMIAVAAVIKNRVNSKRYPNDYCKVIQQPKQFSYRNHLKQGELAPITLKNKLDEQVLKTTIVVAKKTLQDKIKVDIPSGALYYARHDVKNYWTKKKTVVAQVGKHVFYN